MPLITGEPTYERAPEFLLELVTFLFVIALVRAIFGADGLVWVKWVRALDAGWLQVQHCASRAIERSLERIEVRGLKVALIGED